MFMRGSNERNTSSILAEHNNGPDTGCEDNELDAMLDNGLTVIAAHVWAGVADPVGTTRTDEAGPVGTASARLKGYRGDEATSRAFQNISKRPQWIAVDGLRPAWEIHSPAYIRAHAEVFLDNAWINISELRDFLLERNTGDFPGSTSLARPLPLLAQVKREITDVRLSASATPLINKVEPTINSDPIPIRTRILREDNHDILEILSDSEPENGGLDSDEEVSEALIWAASRSSSILPPNISTAIDLCSDDDEPDLEESDTVWQDEGISSHVLIGDYRVTAKVKVGRLEYVSGLPLIYPIHRVPTALIVNLEDPKYNIYDKDGVLHTVDFLIKNKDNDSWKSSSGTADTDVQVMFEPGQPPIRCRRSRMSCKGCFACERVDPVLIQVERYELDPASRDAVFAAQRETRRREGTTAEDTAATFIDVVKKKKCDAIDTQGNKCKGVPMLKAKAQGMSRGHQYWIACSGWTKNFKENHRTHSIPD
ncbi:hypothetical protein B0H10DRAFT_2202252, partial [Mycena sp. CBHHK59/15]